MISKDEALKMAIDFAQRGGSISVPQYYIERDKLINACKEALEQPAQKPEAYIVNYEPNIQWQGLSDDEIEELFPDENKLFSLEDFARAIEAKLKEKNTW